MNANGNGNGNGNGHHQDNGEFAAARLPIKAEIAEAYGVDGPAWRVLTDQIFPAAKSVGSILLALAYCQRRNLDIFKKPVHVVPMWSSSAGRMVETVWPGIAEVRTTAMRTHDYAGIDEVVFGPPVTAAFTGKIKKGASWEQVTKQVTYPEWASVTVYRLDRTGTPRAYKAKVFWLETYATVGQSEVPNDMWETRSYGQLDKCVEAAALRKAFPEELGSTYAAEEMEGKTIDITPNHERPEPTKIPPPAPLQAAEPGREERSKETAPHAESLSVASPTTQAPAVSAILDGDLEIPNEFDRRPRRKKPEPEPYTEAEIDRSQARLAAVLGIEQ